MLSRRDKSQIVIAILSLGIIILAWHFNLPQKWVGGLGMTIAVFGVLLSAFQNLWREQWFWFRVTVLFLLHCVLLWVALNSLLRSRVSINVPALGTAGVSEVVIFVGLIQVWRATKWKLKRKRKG
jgi:O-antigen/teichoic acid export membrane protein